MPLIATPGASDANSFVALTDANDLADALMQLTAWHARRAEQRSALLLATRLICQKVDWYGTPTTTTQSLPWPQLGQADRLGRLILSTIVPEDIQLATVAYALALIAMPGERPPELVGVEEIQVPDVRIRFSATGAPSVLSQIPLHVRAYLLPYGDVVGSGMVRLVRS